MSKQSELPCWKLIQCNQKQKCLLGGDEKKPCWEMVKEDSACSFNICVDCLVFLAKQDNSIITDEELCSILSKRHAKGIKQPECNLTYQLH